MFSIHICFLFELCRRGPRPRNVVSRKNSVLQAELNLFSEEGTWHSDFAVSGPEAV
mgnify:CR=1 FL=1